MPAKRVAPAPAAADATHRAWQSLSLAEAPTDAADVDLSSANVVAVSVTFNPSEGEIERLLDSVLPQVARVVVVDNGSREDLSRRLPRRTDKLHFMALGENFGIAAALNRGISWARTQRATHVLLLDQDSELSPDTVSTLLRAVRLVERKGIKLAAVGPRYIDPRRERPGPFIRVRGLRVERCDCGDPDAVIPVDHVITSGSLIPIATLDAVGPMDEDLFIDYVDVEWGLRAGTLGYESFGVCGAAMHHSLGDDPIRLLGRNLSQHSPLRHYYQFRNAVALYRRGDMPLNWKLVDGFRLLVRFGLYSLLASPRLEHLRLMTLGIWHGLTRRAGRR